MKNRNLGPLPKYWTIGAMEKINVSHAMRRPLSGYVGGEKSTGFWTNKLSNDWQDVFGCNHVIPCNSATTGLMAACMAAGLGPDDKVLVSSYTMSATATAPMMLGCDVH